jgi:hypothetical protein
VYDGPIATQLFLSEGKTMTVHGLYCSTQVDDSTIPAAGTKTSAAAKQEMLDWAKGQKITIPDSVLNPKPVVKK